LLARIEKGDPGCSIGSVFEVATICGVPLFDQEQRQLTNSFSHASRKNGLAAKGRP
jgi:hypothetical protein